ncbi:MAG: hypothetical protein C4518_16185 [Desulfobacteraceae bacterium]|nr:MAG: hypothetical protein C4518_16185 [Desulfobacteraceae bacterium]
MDNFIDQYCDLDRRFLKVSEHKTAEELAKESYISSFLGSETDLNWEDILQHPITVILGEPGSGKSKEFKAQSEKLNFNSVLAFYIPLDRLVSDSFGTVLGQKQLQIFEQWQKNNSKAYFFFDSVDESKLRKPDDFFIALDKISEVIDLKELSRATLVFSSRIFEWRPSTDYFEIIKRFPISEKSSTSESEENIQDNGLIVAYLAPLDRTRVQKYINWHNVYDQENLLFALDENHAWEFTRRPLDVNGLIEFWNSNGRLGSLNEIIEYSVSLCLKESEGRETLDPLSPKIARKGIESLAAAAVLCQNLNFKVPDDAFIVKNAALNSSAILPSSWTTKERRALLSRRIFDAATYGCIRFHHRRTMEYLCACWLNERIKDGCPEKNLLDLLFEKYKGQYLLRPKLAPVAAWLANGDESHNKLVRETLLKTEPEIHFQLGDPAQLPLEYKRKVLRTLSNRYEGCRNIWLDRDEEALSRLADVNLSPDISDLMLNKNMPAKFRIFMLSLVQHKQIKDCYESALQIIADSDEEDTLKTYAVAALMEDADSKIKYKLTEIASSMRVLSVQFSSIICETLYPDSIDEECFINLLRKTRDISIIQYHWYSLKKHLDEILTINQSILLLEYMMDLLETEPFTESRDIKISQYCLWLIKLIPGILLRLFEKESLKQSETILAAKCIPILEKFKDYTGLNNETKIQYFKDALCRHKGIKVEYIWHKIERYRIKNGKEPDWFPLLFISDSFFKIEKNDIFWLLNEAQKKEEDSDRKIALRFAFYIWQAYRLQWQATLIMLRMLFTCQGLRGFSLKYFCQSLISPVKSFWVRKIKMKLFHKYWWTNHWWNIKRKLNRISDYYYIHRYIFSINSGKNIMMLGSLLHEAVSSNDFCRWSVEDWSLLEKKYSRWIAKAVQHGCEISWQRYIPPLPHEKNSNTTSYQTIIGLCGLHSLWKKNKLFFDKLSERDAEIIARYGLSDFNGFPEWFPDFASKLRQVVIKIFKQCIEGEWRFPSSRDSVHEVLSKISEQGEFFWQITKDDLLWQLKIQDPYNPKILEKTLSILMRLPETEMSKDPLISIAIQRVTIYPYKSDFFIIWLVTWIKLMGNGAISFLSAYFLDLGFKEASGLLIRICSELKGERLSRQLHRDRKKYLTPQFLRIFIPLAHMYIQPENDIVRNGEGSYSPTSRDKAQEFRDNLLSILAETEDPTVISILKRLQSLPELSVRKELISHLIQQHMKSMIDLSPWQEDDIRNFENDFEFDPRNDADLYRIACQRLRDIKSQVERSDNSLRDEVLKDWDEAALRKWLKRKLEDRSRQRYTIPQEAEVDRRKKPDLLFENPNINSGIPVEIKWADKHWTAANLLERLENQLFGQYMQADNIRYGIYLLGFIGNKQRWNHPTEKRDIGFEELVNIVKHRAKEIVENCPGINSIQVFSIDFT